MNFWSALRNTRQRALSARLAQQQQQQQQKPPSASLDAAEAAVEALDAQLRKQGGGHVGAADASPAAVMPTSAQPAAPPPNSPPQPVPGGVAASAVNLPEVQSDGAAAMATAAAGSTSGTAPAGGNSDLAEVAGMMQTAIVDASPVDLEL